MALEGWQAIGMVEGLVPTDAAVFTSYNATDITSTTAQEIKAATTGKSIYVTMLVMCNATPAEDAIITIQDDSGTPVEYDRVELSTNAGNGGFLIKKYNPPLVITAGQALDGVSSGSLGDTRIHAFGYVGTAGTYMDRVAAKAFLKAGVVPDDATAMYGFNSTLVTSTTAQEIKAATTAKAHYITRMRIVNETPGEDPYLTIQDDAGTPVQFLKVLCSDLAPHNNGDLEIVFEPPLQTSTGQAVDGVASGSLGDTVIHITGFTATP